VQAGLRACRPGLGQLRGHLRLRGVVFGGGAVERGLADEVLDEQLLLALVVLGGDFLLGQRCARLGCAGGGRLIGGAGIDAQQHLAGAHAVAGLDVELDHGPGHLGRDDGLAQRLDHAVEGGRRWRVGGLGRRRRQRRCGRRGGKGAERGTGGDDEQGKGSQGGHGAGRVDAVELTCIIAYIRK
jgi:hypothetical protein